MHTYMYVHVHVYVTCIDVSVAVCWTCTLLCCFSNSAWDKETSCKEFFNSASLCLDERNSYCEQWNTSRSLYIQCICHVCPSKSEGVNDSTSYMYLCTTFNMWSRLQIKQYIACIHVHVLLEVHICIYQHTWWSEEIVCAERSKESSVCWYCVRRDLASSSSDVTEASSVCSPSTSLSSWETAFLETSCSLCSLEVWATSLSNDTL